MLRTISLTVAALALGQGNAYAYLDPNAGGLLYQLLFPVLIAIAGAWAVLRHKIAQFFATLAKRIRGK
jgi:hypothetical protein